MKLNRRDLLAAAPAAGTAWLAAGVGAAEKAPDSSKAAKDLKITGLKVTPIALPDPPILAAHGCHGPYFLRNVVEIETDAGITGIGETKGGADVTAALERARNMIVGQNPLAYRRTAAELMKLGGPAYAGIELACLDAAGRATGLRLCELLGGPVRDKIEVAAYLFYRFAADDPRVLDDPRIVDGRGRGDKALDAWGEVRSPEAMAELAFQFHKRWGFRVQKLKAGVLSPDEELATLQAISARLGGQAPLRIDPNARWTIPTALRIAQGLKKLPLEYYEDPVAGQEAMAEVRRQTGLTMSTNMCVTRLAHIPQAVVTRPIDVVLCDHHSWGGITSCQALGMLSGPLGWKVSQHSNSHAGITMAAMLHIAAVIPELTYPSDTHYPHLVEGADIIVGPNLPIVDGHMNLPSAPGVGVQLDRDRLAKAHEVYKKCGMTGRDDGATMRRIVPGWEKTPL